MSLAHRAPKLLPKRDLSAGTEAIVVWDPIPSAISAPLPTIQSRISLSATPSRTAIRNRSDIEHSL
jgi:hypothetical protein